MTTVTITFAAETAQQAVIATINTAMTAECAVAADSTHLVLQGQGPGKSIIVGAGSALTKLGLVAGTTQFYFPSVVDTTNVTLASAALFAAPPPPQAVEYWRRRSERSARFTPAGQSRGSWLSMSRPITLCPTTRSTARRSSRPRASASG